MRTRNVVGLLVVFLATVSCYHATIETAAAPSTVVIEKPFASSWIYGLVPPSTVETAAKCPGGVAKVETQQSFVNGLVAFLTIGIYTPMSIRVTCAAPGAAAQSSPASPADSAATPSHVIEQIQAAADRAVERRTPVYVELR